jgi:hypothetical protein
MRHDPPSEKVPLAITTATSPTEDIIAQARRLAEELHAGYAPRRNVTAAQIFRETTARRLLIVERDCLRLRDEAGGEYFFHPNLALVRGLNILRGARDLFADASGLNIGDRLLDCTVGFASEATLGCLLVGDTGKVVGLESIPELAAVTRAGVASFRLQTKRIEAAMRRVEIVAADYREYLARCDSKAFDVVYFDPFFEERLPGAENSVSPLARFGDPAPLDEQSLGEARRVARCRVVIKHPKQERLPAGIAAAVVSTVTTRKNRLQYDILPPF